MKHKFCCEDMYDHVSSGELHIGYDERTRFYYIDYLEIAGGGQQLLNYCPWCGARLPKELIDEYAALVFDQLGYDPLDLDLEEKLPAEFKSDAWWKNRGL